MLRKFKWIAVLFTVLALVFMGCPESPKVKSEPPPGEGDNVVFDIQEYFKEQKLTIGDTLRDKIFPDNAFFTGADSDGAAATYRIIAGDGEGKLALEVTVKESWAGVDLKDEGIEFRVGDKVYLKFGHKPGTASGAALIFNALHSGWQPIRGWTYGDSGESPQQNTLTLTSAHIQQIKKITTGDGDRSDGPATLRLRSNSVNSIITIYELKVTGDREGDAPEPTDPVCTCGEDCECDCDDDCGPTCPDCTPEGAVTVKVKLGSEEVDAKLTAVGGTITAENGSFTFSKTSNYQSSFARFNVDLGADTLANFKEFKFRLTPVSGDLGYKRVYLTASNSEYTRIEEADTALAISQPVSGEIGPQYNFTAGSAENITFTIDSAKAALLTGKVNFAVYCHQGSYSGEIQTVMTFSNIEFVLTNPVNNFEIAFPAPVAGQTAAVSINNHAQLNGAISWSPALVGGIFGSETDYTATIALSPKIGFTLIGLPSSVQFKVNGQNATYNQAARAVQYVFPKTGTALPFPNDASLAVTAGGNPVTAPVETFTVLTAVYTAGTGGPASVSNIWLKDGVVINNETDSTFTPLTSGTYIARVTAPGYATLSSVEITVINKTFGTISVTGTPETYQTLTASHSESAANLSYKWFKGEAEIAGAAAQTYAPILPGDYRVQISAPGYTSKTSAAVTVAATRGPITINVTVDGAAVSSAVNGVNSTIAALAGNKGYRNTKEYGNQSTYVQFSVNLGENLSNFEAIKFDYGALSGDTNYKKFFLLAKTGAFSGDLPLTDGNTPPDPSLVAAANPFNTTNALHLYNGGTNFSGGSVVTLLIDETASAVLDGNTTLNFVIYSHMAADSSGAPTSFNIDNITFVKKSTTPFTGTKTLQIQTGSGQADLTIGKGWILGEDFTAIMNAVSPARLEFTVIVTGGDLSEAAGRLDLDANTESTFFLDGDAITNGATGVRTVTVDTAFKAYFTGNNGIFINIWDSKVKITKVELIAGS